MPYLVARRRRQGSIGRYHCQRGIGRFAIMGVRRRRLSIGEHVGRRVPADFQSWTKADPRQSARKVCFEWIMCWAIELSQRVEQEGPIGLRSCTSAYVITLPQWGIFQVCTLSV
jgi:hypothetical protein